MTGDELDLAKAARLRLVYIAGPYTAATAWQRTRNVYRAQALAQQVASLGLGIFPVCPHLMGLGFEDAREPAWWYEGTAEVMRRCDAVLASRDWLRSKGAVAEVTEARRLGLPVTLDVDALPGLLGLRSREASR